MIRFSTKLYETNKPNANKRVYAYGCFEHIPKDALFPVFLNEETSLENFICNATVDWQEHEITIKTEPICNNWRYEKTYKAISEAFARGNIAMIPCGQGDMLYDEEKAAYIIKNYNLTHLYITNQPAFRFESKVEVI